MLLAKMLHIVLWYAKLFMPLYCSDANCWSFSLGSIPERWTIWKTFHFRRPWAHLRKLWSNLNRQGYQTSPSQTSSRYCVTPRSDIPNRLSLISLQFPFTNWIWWLNVSLGYLGRLLFLTFNPQPSLQGHICQFSKGLAYLYYSLLAVFLFTVWLCPWTLGVGWVRGCLSKKTIASFPFLPSLLDDAQQPSGDPLGHSDEKWPVGTTEPPAPEP